MPLQLPGTIPKLADFFRKASRLDPEALRAAEQERPLLREVGLGALSGESLDSPDPRSDATLRDDDHGADLRRAADVTAPAQLQAALRTVLEACHLDGSHHLFVLLPEERHRPRIDRLAVVPIVRDHRLRGTQDPAIHQFLHAANLLRRERLAIGEVEPQPVGRHQRSGLTHSRTQNVPQRRLEQVGRRVVALDRSAPRRRHLGVDRLCLPQVAPLDLHEMETGAHCVHPGIGDPRFAAVPA